MTTADYLDQLNEQQRAAVEYCDGPQLVIAGAGSGKTRVLTYKIVHLLSQGYEPYRILALTFTNKAAREMKERIASLIGERKASRLWMGTFHSIFARILRQNAERLGFKRDFTIYDTTDSKSLIKTIIKDMQLDEKTYKPSTVQAAISNAKNHLISPDDYAMDRDIMEADRRAQRPLIYAIYKAYRQRCFLANAMDFDDLLYFTNVLMRDNPEIRSHYQEFFRYILVDEYQDTNFAQHVIVSSICNVEQKLCVVGDDAQSIYSFRGANIRNILNLKKGYPKLEIFKLEQNYRSTQNIVNAANSLISKNKQQIPKTVFSHNDEGERVDVIQCYSDMEEGVVVSNRISQLKMATKDSYEDFAILYRTNAQSRLLEEALRKRNIPYRIYGGLSFYQRKEIKDAIAYSRLTVNPNDDEALKRIINYPARGIGDTTVNKLQRAAMDNNISLWETISRHAELEIGFNSGTARKLAAFQELIQTFIEMNAAGEDAYTMAQAIIGNTRLLSSLVTDSTPESISKQENLRELLSGTAQFVTDRREADPEASVTLSDFLQEVSLATDQDANETSEERVTLMTVHSAKGLEFGNVVVVGVEDDFFPSGMSKGSLAEIEEERRLLYVAITRAKRRCILTYTTQRYINGKQDARLPSPFLRDISSKYLSLSSGTNFQFGETRASFNAFSDSFHSQGYRAVPRPVEATQRPWLNRETPKKETTTPNTVTAAAPGEYVTHRSDQLRTGTRIEHPRFGQGVIRDIDTSVQDHKVTVQFNNADTKVLLLKFAKFKILSK